MMAGSDLMFPGYSGETLTRLRASGEAKVWRRTKPAFWPGVSSEELFVAALLRRSLVRLRRATFTGLRALFKLARRAATGGDLVPSTPAWWGKLFPLARHHRGPQRCPNRGEEEGIVSPPARRCASPVGINTQVLKDLGAVPGVAGAGWATDWERWVTSAGCRLGNVVKLDGPADAARYGPAALDAKIYPEGANASKGRFNAYFAQNASDAELEEVISKRVRRENPTCEAAQYLFGPGMLERIYPGFFGVEFSERRLQDAVRKGNC